MGELTDSGRSRALLVGASIALLLAWSAVVPIFESPDEVHHWQYARYLHEERRLPLYGPDFVEANSPPLYYALLAPLATSSAFPPTLVWLDAKGTLVVPFAPRLYHNAGGDFARYWPIRLGRLLTVLMSAATVWFCWQAGLLAGGTSAAILSASLVAFLPQFTFRGSTISNDALVTTMSAATVLCIVRLMEQPFTWRAGAGAALALSAAYLAKINAICLCAPLALALWWNHQPTSVRLVRVAGVLGLACLIVAPWSLRNIALYGDPFASGAMWGAVGHIMSSRPLTSPYFWTTFPTVLSRSFVGVFGWMNIMLPEGYYWIFWTIGLSGLAGVTVQISKRSLSARLPVVLGAIVILNFGVVLHINRSFEQPQGRYMFVALPALALLIAMGLKALTRYGAGALALCLCFLNVLILCRHVIPAYYPPVTSTLSNAGVALVSPYVLDLIPLPNGSAEVSGVDPQLGFETRIEAATVGFLAFDLTGICDEGDVAGSVYFGAEGRPASEAQQVEFTWRADGRKRLIRVPLLRHPLWKGTITIVRIDPINRSLRRHQGDWVQVENVRLIGNLSLLVSQSSDK